VVDASLRSAGGLDANVLERAGGGPALLVLHCSLASAANVAPLIPYLEPNVYVVAPDLPGHGQTMRDPSRDLMAQSVAMAADLLRDLDGPAHVFGHSYGAVIGLELARRHPDLVASLTLFEPVLFGLLEDADHPALTAERVQQEALRDAFDTSAEAASIHFIDRWGIRGGWQALPEMAREGVVANIDIVKHSRPSLQGGPEERLTLDTLAEIKAPVALLCGDETQAVVHAILDVLNDALDVRQRSMIVGAGHMGPLTHPGRIAEVLADMMRG
jgi:pimeloyl-ACP methyl ester carboxylesterase